MLILKIKKSLNLLLHNRIGFLAQIICHIPCIVTDKLYVKLQYKSKLGQFPNLKSPRTFTEKIQWLKLYDHNPLYTKLVDKVAVKEYVSQILGEEYIIPTLHVWNEVSDIHFDKLPEKFVLKCNHTGGGSVFICKDKTKFDFETVKRKLSKQLKTNTFLHTREWPYKNVPRKILCEQYLEDDSGDLRDYKFYCFNGKPFIVLVATNRFTSHNFDYFDLNFNPILIESSFGKVSSQLPTKPKNFDKMVDVAETLSRGIPHVRIDLYNVNGHIYMGEFTFYDASGFDDFGSEKWNLKLGNQIKLPDLKSIVS